MNCLLFLVTVVISVAFVTTIIALAVPVWQASSVEVTESVTVKTYTYTGLWSVCTRKEIVGDSTISCDTYLEDGTPYPGSVKGVQAMMILGGALCAAAFVTIIVKWCFLKENKLLGKIVAGMCIGAAVFLLIGVIVWSSAVKEDQKFNTSDLNAGFALSIVAAALLVTAGVFVCFVK